MGTTTLMGSGDRLEPLDTDTVTGNAFQFLGVAPLLGRGIVPDDGKPGAPPVFVLSYKAWLSRFGRAPNIVGQSFLLNDKPTTLVGIMPRRFAFWVGTFGCPRPSTPPNLEPREVASFYGHLEPKLETGAAEAELGGLAKRLSAIYPRSYPARFTVRLDRLGYIAVGQFRTALLTLLAAVGLLLLIACANVANLLLARATVRQKSWPCG